MASIKLGSKSDVFHLDAHTWLCTTGLPSDITVEVGDKSFHLHKFPLLSRSGLLENLIGQFSKEYERKCVLQLPNIPGGPKTFLLMAKFCYGVKMELNALNIVSLRCAAEYLRMNEDYGEGNLISQTENFLEEVFGNWTDSIKALATCEEVLSYAEELQIISRCMNSLAMKACADTSLFRLPMSTPGPISNPTTEPGTLFWNGIDVSAKPYKVSEDWWHEDVSVLRLPLYKRLILALEMKGMKSKSIAGSLISYAKKHLPLLCKQSSFENGNRAPPGLTATTTLTESDQKILLEEITELLPTEKGVTPTEFLLRLLRTSMILHASLSCRDKLEKHVGAQLDQAVLEDLLIPDMGCYVETLYDIDCVQRILDHFLLGERYPYDCSSITASDEGQLMGCCSHSLTPMTMVANLIDGYLSEVGPDVNLKLSKFHSLAAVIPDYARPLHDGIYRAIDVYLKAHPWLIDSEREQICRLINCQKLSIEGSTHAAQNERLPLRLIVQVLFFEQLRLRTSIAGWFFVSDNLDNSQPNSRNLALVRNSNNSVPQSGSIQEDDQIVPIDDMRERVLELEKECLSMKQELEKLVKTKGGWTMMLKMLRLRIKLKASPSGRKGGKIPNGSRAAPGSIMNGRENQISV